MKRPDASSSDAIFGPLQALRRAVEALRPYIETPDQQSDLFVIEDAVARLSRPRATVASGLADFDPTRLSHLLDITGPELGPELLARLTEDLTATQDRLDLGAATADWKHLREGSHVLISLSGSVGALSLQAMSESLNAIAHRQDRDALEALMPPLAGELATLIQLIRATRAPNGTA
jgi:two-component system aerobic respiration control sensor histidine kinase ArcB